MTTPTDIILNIFGVTKLFSENWKCATLLETSGKSARKVGLHIKVVTVS